jgi:hypothetical protein
MQLPELLVATLGASTFLSPRRNGPVTDGIGDACVPTLSGTLVGSLIGATAVVLTDSVTFRSTGAFEGADL